MGEVGSWMEGLGEMGLDRKFGKNPKKPLTNLALSPSSPTHP